MIATISEIETAQLARLMEFAADVHELAGERPDLQLHELIDQLYADVLLLRGDD